MSYWFHVLAKYKCGAQSLHIPSGPYIDKDARKTPKLIFTGVGPDKWYLWESKLIIVQEMVLTEFYVFLHFKNHGGHLWIIAFIPLPEEQVMHLIKLDIPYSCTSIVAHLWASIAICKNSWKSKQLCMAWKNDCGLRSGTFLVLVQSNVMYYNLRHFSKLCKNTFPTIIKAAKSNQTD